MEKDDEVKNGKGTSNTTAFRQYDSRLGRWLTIDPVIKVHESPYAAFANNPIWFADPNGADSVKVNNNWVWRIESGDSFSSISERTGVNEVELKVNNPSTMGMSVVTGSGAAGQRTRAN